MKRILLTGATGGLGQALVDVFLAAGHHVRGIHGARLERAGALRAHHALAGARLELQQADLRDAAATADLARKIKEEGPWDAFLHLAASPLEVAPLTKQTISQFEDAWRASLTGALLLTQALLPTMRQRGRGQLIYCLSKVTHGTPPRGMAAYTSAKYALWGLARSIAAECVGSGISVIAVSPGVMDTSLLGRLPEVAKAQLAASGPGGRFASPARVAQEIGKLIETTSGDFHDVNLLIEPEDESSS